MSCGCGGECCGQPEGLGYVAPQAMAMRYPPHIRRIGPRGLGFLWWGGGESGGGGDYWDEYDLSPAEWDWLYGNYGGGGGGGGGDFWGFNNPFWGFNDIPDVGLVDTLQSEKGGAPLNDAWQQLLDWWRELTGGYTPNVPLPGPEPNTSTLPPFSGYCPPNTYCADFPTCSQCVPLNETPAQKARRLAEQAAKAAAQKKAQQKQPCPPNTGLVKNAQGQCVCPPGYAPNAQLKKCVLVNASLAAQSNQAPDWLKWALLAGLVVLVVKR